MRITCPHCRESVATRSSLRPHDALYWAYAQCTNCGWGGKIQIEFLTTSAPSRMPRPGVQIPADPSLHRWLREQNLLETPDSDARQNDRAHKKATNHATQENDHE